MYFIFDIKPKKQKNKQNKTMNHCPEYIGNKEPRCKDCFKNKFCQKQQK